MNMKILSEHAKSITEIMDALSEAGSDFGKLSRIRHEKIEPEIAGLKSDLGLAAVSVDEYNVLFGILCLCRGYVREHDDSWFSVGQLRKEEP